MCQITITREVVIIRLATSFVTTAALSGASRSAGGALATLGEGAAVESGLGIDGVVAGASSNATGASAMSFVVVGAASSAGSSSGAGVAAPSAGAVAERGV